MNEAQRNHQFKKAASHVAKAMLTKERIQELMGGGDLIHLRSRMVTFLILLDDEIDRFRKARTRATAKKPVSHLFIGLLPVRWQRRVDPD